MLNKSSLALSFFTLMIAVGAALMLPVSNPSALAADPLGDIEAAAKILLASLIGIPAFVAGVLAILEYLGYLTSDLSDKVQIYLNTVLYLTCFFAVLFGKTDIVILIDRYASGVAPILAAILALLTGGFYSIATTRKFATHFRQLAPVRKVLYERES